MTKILFITSSCIGDNILATSILEGLKKTFDTSEITLATSVYAKELYSDDTGLERIIAIDKKRYHRHWFDFYKQVYHQKWDVVLDLRGSALSYFLRSKKRFVWSNKHPVIPKVEAFKAFLHKNNIHFCEPKLYLASSRNDAANQTLGNGDQPVIAIGATASWPAKQWPRGYYEALLERMLSSTWKGAKLVFVAGPKERDYIAPLEEKFSRSVIKLPQEMHILDLAAVIQNASFYLGNDSGLMHMAAALGVPTLGLFGPSPDQIYAPYGKKAHFIRTQESYPELVALYKEKPSDMLMQSLSVDQVQSKIENILSL